MIKKTVSSVQCHLMEWGKKSSTMNMKSWYKTVKSICDNLIHLRQSEHI